MDIPDFDKLSRKATAKAIAFAERALGEDGFSDQILLSAAYFTVAAALRKVKVEKDSI